VNKTLLKSKPKINWTNTLFFLILPTVVVTGIIYLIQTKSLHGATFLFAFIYFIVSGLAITCGYHRLFAHVTYQASWPVRLFFLLFGAGAFQGSLLEWCSDHRNHHLFTDTDKDPYNPKRGFWFSHITWLFTLEKKRDFNNVKDLQKDPLIRFQHRYYKTVSIAIGFILPTAIAALWGDALGGLIIAAALRITLVHHSTFLINSLSHIAGKATYSDRTSSCDNWFTALLTFGEGYHNFHHKFPLDYRNGIRFFHFDPSKWLIRLLAYAGLTYNLKKVSWKRILECRLQMDEKRLRERIKQINQISSLKEETLRLLSLIQPSREAIFQAISKIEGLEKYYHELKNKRREFVSEKLVEYRRCVKQCKQQLASSKRDLKDTLNIWMHLVTKGAQLSFN